MSKTKLSGIVSIVCIAALLMSFAACGKTNENTGNTSTAAVGETNGKPEETTAGSEPVTLTVMTNITGRGDLTKDTYIFKEMANVLGMTIIPENYEEYETKFNLRFASDDLPDIVIIPNDTSYYNNGASGKFIPLSDHFDKLPNFTRFIQKYPDMEGAIKLDDSKIYGLPIVLDINRILWTQVIRKDVLDKQGISVDNIKTQDDLYNALKGIKEEFGSKPVWFGRAGQDAFWFYMNSISMNFGTRNRVYFNEDKKQFAAGPLEENYKTMLQFMNKCYKEGILHPDFVTFGDQQLDAALNKVEWGFFIDYFAKIPKEIAEGVAYVLPPVEINGSKPKIAREANFTMGSGVKAISSKTKNLDAALKFLDYVYSDEGIFFLSYGKPGDFVVADESAPYKEWKFRWKDEYKFNGVNDDKAGAKEVWEYGLFEGKITGSWISTQMLGVDLWQTGAANVVIPTQELFEKAGAIGGAAPSPRFTQAETEQKMQMEEAINMKIDAFTIDVIKGQKTMADFDKFQEELKKMGMDDLIKIYNDAYSRIK